MQRNGPDFARQRLLDGAKQLTEMAEKAPEESLNRTYDALAKVYKAYMAMSFPAAEAGKKGPSGKRWRITDGYGDHIVATSISEAAELTGLQPHSLSVLLSRHKGKYIANRQDAEGNPIYITVERLEDEESQKTDDAKTSKNRAKRRQRKVFVS